MLSKNRRERRESYRWARVRPRNHPEKKMSEKGGRENPCESKPLQAKGYMLVAIASSAY